MIIFRRIFPNGECHARALLFQTFNHSTEFLTVGLALKWVTSGMDKSKQLFFAHRPSPLAPAILLR